MRIFDRYERIGEFCERGLIDLRTRLAGLPTETDGVLVSSFVRRVDRTSCHHMAVPTTPLPTPMAFQAETIAAVLGEIALNPPGAGWSSGRGLPR
jgi:hypothetical protein